MIGRLSDTGQVAEEPKLASMPEIQQAFLADSGRSKRDGGSIRRRAQALLLRLLTRIDEASRLKLKQRESASRAPVGVDR